MEKVLSIFQRLWSDKKDRDRIGKEQIQIWAKTEYGKDWRHAYNYYMASGHMPKEEVRGFKNV